MAGVIFWASGTRDVKGMEGLERYPTPQQVAAPRRRRLIYEGPLCLIPPGTSVEGQEALIREFLESIRSTLHDPVFCDFLNGLANLIARRIRAGGSRSLKC